MAAPTGDLQLKIVERVVSLPAVSIACTVAFQTYLNVKASNKFLDFTLNTIEKAGGFVTRQSMPVIKKFENQIKRVDDIACCGLENLKGIAPVITEQPEELGIMILNYALTSYNEIARNGRIRIAATKHNVRGAIDNTIQDILSSLPLKVAAELSHRIMDELEASLLGDNKEALLPTGSQDALSPWARAELLKHRLVLKVNTEIDYNIQKVVFNVAKVYNDRFAVLGAPITRLSAMTILIAADIMQCLRSIINSPELFLQYMLVICYSWFFDLHEKQM